MSLRLSMRVVSMAVLVLVCGLWCSAVGGQAVGRVHSALHQIRRTHDTSLPDALLHPAAQANNINVQPQLLTADFLGTPFSKGVDAVIIVAVIVAAALFVLGCYCCCSGHFGHKDERARLEVQRTQSRLQLQSEADAREARRISRTEQYAPDLVLHSPMNSPMAGPPTISIAGGAHKWDYDPHEHERHILAASPQFANGTGGLRMHQFTTNNGSFSHAHDYVQTSVPPVATIATLPQVVMHVHSPVPAVSPPGGSSHLAVPIAV